MRTVAVTRHLPGLSLMLAVLGLQGCLWIGASERSDRLDQLDEDGDGVLAGDEVSCGANGDQSPNKYPGAVEVEYDGIDNDCSGGDLVDKDSDGYPGITEEEYAEATASVDPAELEPYPAEFVGKGLDCNDDPNQGGAAVNPGVVNDQPYDAQDANCDGFNEWDSDSDGYIKAIGDSDGDGVDDGVAVFEQFKANYGYEFPNVQPGDCDDDDEDVNPGLTGVDDVPYDGKDADCLGNNDFDADGDGWYPAAYELEFVDYRDTYGPTVSWFADQPGDCFDSCLVSHQEPSGSPLPAEADRDGNGLVDFCEANVAGFPFDEVDPATVNPGAAEVFYNGADDDCTPLSDFDADLDGYTTEGISAGAVALYYDLWGGDSLATATGDCDDSDPTVNPGQLEIIADGTDQDCYQSPAADSAVLHVVDGSGWTNPGQVEVVRTDVGWVVTVPADNVEIFGSPTRDNMFLIDEIEAGVTRPRVTTILQNRSGIYGANDLLSLGTALYIGTAFLSDTSEYHALQQWDYVWDGTAYTYDLFGGAAKTADVEDWPAPVDLSIELSAGGATWTAGCGDGAIYFTEAGIAVQGRIGVAPGLVGATTCLVQENVAGDPEITACSASTCKRYAVADGNPLTLTEIALPGPWVGDKWRRIERHDEMLTLVPPSGDGVTLRTAGADVGTYFGSEVVVAADALVESGHTLLAAVVTSDATLENEVRLLDIVNGNIVSTTVLGFGEWTPPSGGAPITGSPTDVGLDVFVDGAEIQVLVAAAASGDDPAGCLVDCPDDDQVGWAILILE